MHLYTHAAVEGATIVPADECGRPSELPPWSDDDENFVVPPTWAQEPVRSFPRAAPRRRVGHRTPARVANDGHRAGLDGWDGRIVRFRRDQRQAAALLASAAASPQARRNGLRDRGAPF